MGYIMIWNEGELGAFTTEFYQQLRYGHIFGQKVTVTKPTTFFPTYSPETMVQFISHVSLLQILI